MSAKKRDIYSYNQIIIYFASSVNRPRIKIKDKIYLDKKGFTLIMDKYKFGNFFT